MKSPEMEDLSVLSAGEIEIISFSQDPTRTTPDRTMENPTCEYDSTEHQDHHQLVQSRLHGPRAERPQEAGSEAEQFQQVQHPHPALPRPRFVSL